MAYLLNDQNFENILFCYHCLTWSIFVLFTIMETIDWYIQNDWKVDICIYCSESDQKYLNRKTEKLWDYNYKL